MLRTAIPLVLLAGLAACGAGLPPALVPAAAPSASADVVQAWVQPLSLPGRTLIRFRWQYRNDKSAAGGRGSVRIASPDSLRLDTAGPLGSGAAAALVVGEQSVWVQPPDAIEKLVPNFPLMWAMFGIARLPAADARVEGVADSTATAWRYAMGADTMEYRRTASLLEGQYRSAGKLVGRTETTFGPDGALVKARLTVPSVPARLDLTFTRVTKGAEFEPDVWQPRAPDTTTAGS